MATHTVGEHPAVPKIRTLLALAASAVKVGQHGEAAAAGNAARKMADEAGLRRGYVHAWVGCAWVREYMLDDAILPQWIAPTPAAMWNVHKASSRMSDPTGSIIVGCITTGVVNARGCLVHLADWSDVHHPATFEPRALGM